MCARFRGRPAGTQGESARPRSCGAPKPPNIAKVDRAAPGGGGGACLSLHRSKASRGDVAMWFSSKTKTAMPPKEKALPGRATALPVVNRHFVNGNAIKPPFPAGLELAMFGLGCFWGAEKAFWKEPGVYSTAVGYAAGYTPNPTY